MLTDALNLLSQGFSVIPLKPKGKEPLIPWQEFQNRKASADEMQNWFRQYPQANVGIVTGNISGIVIVDLDGSPGERWLKQRAIVSPLVALTGKGRHLYFKWTEEIRNSASKIAEGVDIRGDGGYVVAPPSIHPNGLRYRWLAKPNFSALCTLPTDIWKATQAATDLTIPDVKPADWISTALEGMKNGHIHNTLISVLGKFRSHNFSEEDTYKLLAPYAFENGKPFEGLRDKIKEIWGRYDAGSVSKTSVVRSGDLVLHTPQSSRQLYDNIQLRKQQSKLDFPTGYPNFDRLTRGLVKGDILTVAARTGSGKTNWLIGPSRELCRIGRKVLYFSTEMSFDQIWDRYKATLEKSESFEAHLFTICDEFSPNLERIEEALRQVMPDVFIFDHINNVGDEQTALSEFMKGLKFLAREFDIPGIVSAQLNRSADWVENGERIKPRLSMIKGSGTIEEVSSTVLLLSETRVTLEGSEIEGVIDKARWGDKGVVHFMLKKDPYRMEEVQ